MEEINPNAQLNALNTKPFLKHAKAFHHQNAKAFHHLKCLFLVIHEAIERYNYHRR